MEQSPDRSENTNHSQSKTSSDNQSNKRANSESGEDVSRKKEKTTYVYQKRAGTAGISGHLYETKLTALFLLRALNKKNRFFLGTNRDGIGAFDDIIIRHEFNEQEKPRVIFIQAKHRDDPTKRKLTIKQVQKIDGDFSLCKYLHSYLKIRQEFNENSDDGVFRGKFENIDCEFVIYTSAEENFSKKKIIEHCTNNYDIIYSSKTGKIFQFNYEEKDIDLLVNTAGERDRSLIKDFLDKLKFYTDQSKEDEVEDILKNEIEKHYNVENEQNKLLFRVKRDAIFYKFHDIVQKWWMLPGEAPYLTENCDFFDQARNHVIHMPLLNILTFIFFNKINDFEFNQESIQALELKEFMTLLDKQILNIVTDENTLSSIKLVQYFKNSKDYIDLDYILKESIYKEAISDFKNTGSDTLIIVCKEHHTNRDKNSELYKELKCIIDGKLSKKIILITKTNDILAKMFKKDFPTKYIKKRDGKNGFSNLTTEFQNKLLNKGKVIFQGEEVSLCTLIDEESKYLIHGEVLFKLINKEVIEIGKPLSDLGDVKDYFIDRKFNHKTENKKYTEEKKSFEFAFNSKGIVEPEIQKVDSDSFDEFIKMCRKHKTSDILWTKTNGDKRVWKQSYVASSEEDKPQKVTYKHGKVVIIVAEPGMGKSTIVTHLAAKIKKSNPSLWVLRVNMLDYSEELKNQKDKETRFDEIETIKFLYMTAGFKAFLKEKREDMIKNNFKSISVEDNKVSVQFYGETIKGLNLLEIELFNHCYNEGKMALLFDGFDEISPDYKEKCIEILQTLKYSKVARIWIATRPYGILNQLERDLNTISHELRPFDEKDQRRFLDKFWSKNLKLEKLDDERFNIFTDELCGRFSESIHDWKNRFLGIPLQIYMFARVFQKTFKEFYYSSEQMLSDAHEKKLSEQLNLVTLYDRFIYIKFMEIYFIEKRPFIPTAYPCMKDSIDTQYKIFIKDHKTLAVYALFKENEIKKLLSKQEISDACDLIINIEQGKERYGIINKIVNGKPHFVHRTFADYFVTMFFSDKLKSNSSIESIWEFLLNTVFIINYENVITFFDSKLAKDHELANLSSKNSHKKVVVDLLLQECTGITSSLWLVFLWDLVEIANFFLKCFEGELNENNLNNFIGLITHDALLRLAIEKGNKEVITTLIKYVKDVNAERLIEVFNIGGMHNNKPLHSAINDNNKEIVDILLGDIKDTNQIVQIINTCNIEGLTALHLAAQMSCIPILLQYIHKLDTKQCWEVFSTTDCNGRVPAHYAAFNNDFKFFDDLDGLLNHNQFCEICLAADGNNLTPLDLFNPGTHEITESLNKFEKVMSNIEALKIKINSYVESDIEYNGKHRKSIADLSKCVSESVRRRCRQYKLYYHDSSFESRNIQVCGIQDLLLD